MANFSTELICMKCRRLYPVELRKMRLNIHHPCPACGSWNSISEEQAIKTQRLLEALERREKEATSPKPLANA